MVPHYVFCYFRADTKETARFAVLQAAFSDCSKNTEGLFSFDQGLKRDFKLKSRNYEPNFVTFLLNIGIVQEERSNASLHILARKVFRLAPLQE